MTDELTLDILEPDTPDNQLNQDTTADLPETESEGNAQEASTQPQEQEDQQNNNQEQEKQIYTQEELERLLVDDTEVDTSRLSAEGKALMKSFQKGYTPKFQALAAKEKELDQKRQSLDEQRLQKENPKEYLYQQFRKNPTGIIREINAEIERLESSPDQYDEETKKNVLRLQSTKDELLLRRQDDMERTKYKESMSSRVYTEIIEDIPDFKEKAPKLTEFAVGLGLSQRELQVLSDPTIVGPMAAKITKAINKAYDLVNAGKNAERKVNKQAPRQLGRAGAGGNFSSPTKDPTKMSTEEYRKWRNQ